MMIYLSIINILTFFVYGIDKLKAKEHWWRISEATLLLLAAIGDSIGAWLGMKVWHHKILHKKFKYGVPVIFLCCKSHVIWHDKWHDKIYFMALTV